MLPQKNRLPVSGFKRRFEKTINSPYFLLRFNSNNLGYNRFGVVVSTKVDKRSVRRNYLKRCFHEYFRKLPDAINADFLLIVSPKADPVDFKEIKKELDRLTEGLKIRN